MYATIRNTLNSLSTLHLAESRDQRVRFINESADIFEVIAQWMYSGGQINSRTLVQRALALQDTDLCKAMFSVYFLANRLLIEDLETDVLAQLQQLLARDDICLLIDADLILKIYDNTSEHSPLRDLVGYRSVEMAA